MKDLEMGILKIFFVCLVCFFGFLYVDGFFGFYVIIEMFKWFKLVLGCLKGMEDFINSKYKKLFFLFVNIRIFNL